MKKLTPLFFLIFLACSGEEKNSFSNWYGERWQKEECAFDTPLQGMQILELYSDSLRVDTIYRSMMGPYERQQFELDVNDSLLWITGYKVFVEGEHLKSADFLCHSNLNILETENFPWTTTFGNLNSRVFTLSQGIETVHMPSGFGIPVPGVQVFELVSQVLNHNIPNIDAKVQHRVEIYFIRESDLECRLRPLQQESIFIFKQYEGPEGLFGTADSRIDSLRQPSCGFEEVILADSITPFNQFHDPQGRKFTGHWKVYPGEERIKMDITTLLRPNDEKKIHFILCHVHPFCTELILKNETTGEVMYRSEVTSTSEGIGLIEVPPYSSTEGLSLNEYHRYSLESNYNNTSDDTLSAMSVMYLYTSLK